MERVWGEEGFGGDPHEYAWLEQNYGITEAEDVRWIDVLTYHSGEVEMFDGHHLEGEEEREEVLAFLEDPEAVIAFLETLLKRYQSNTATYPRA
ncbi:MAG: hypothetical protein H0X24_19690 [Ktedonobacterales bacterium]|nr:hypothetical protein [Ktedonobacterales bacterium]